MEKGDNAVDTDEEDDENPTTEEVDESEEEEYFRLNFQSISLLQFEEASKNPYPVTLAAKRKIDHDKTVLGNSLKTKFGKTLFL